MNISRVFTALILLLSLSGNYLDAQSRYLINTGGFYNGSFLEDKVSGFGFLMGMEYKYNDFLALELRTRYGFYSFWKEHDVMLEYYYPDAGKSILEYRLVNSPQIGIAPKFYQKLDVFYDGLFLFLESEFAIGYMSGQIEYNGKPSAVRRVKEPISFYVISVGLEHRFDNSHLKKRNWIFFGSFGYSSLNFRENIRKHQPENYQGRIPNQDTGFMLNFGVKLPLWSKK